MCPLLFLVLVIASGFAKSSSETPCPPGLETRVNSFYLQEKNETCFRFVVNHRLTYREATLDCAKDGGTLALAKTEDINDYLTEQAHDYYGVADEIWIGLHDIKDESRFIWQDQTELQYRNFAEDNGLENNWFIKQFEDCVALNPKDGLWYDHPCHPDIASLVFRSEPQKMYICQY